jgi:hypothetical protein
MDRYGNQGRWSLGEVNAIGPDIDCPKRFKRYGWAGVSLNRNPTS